MGPVAAIVGVATFFLVVVIPHVLQPEYLPQHQLMSELVPGARWVGDVPRIPGPRHCGFCGPGGNRASAGYRILPALAAQCFPAAGVFHAVIRTDIAQRLAATCFPVWLGVVSWNMARRLACGHTSDIPDPTYNARRKMLPSPLGGARLMSSIAITEAVK